MARRKCSMSTAVFLTSDEYTSEPTIGQKGTLLPSSCATPSASAVLPLPGAPARDEWAQPDLCISLGSVVAGVLLAHWKIREGAPVHGHCHTHTSVDTCKGTVAAAAARLS